MSFRILNFANVAGLVATLCLGAPVAAQEPSATAAEARVERLERQVDALSRQVAELTAALERVLAAQGATSPAVTPPAAPAERLAEVERRQEAIAAELETLRIGESAVVAETGEYGFGPAASKVYRQDQGVSIGGYGEMVYQNRSSERDDDSPSGAVDDVDFLRAIVYLGYKFSDRWLFNSELEFEHASTGQGGEASVEFAYLDYLWRPELGFRAGLLLMPMGFVNELHEPPVFLGVKRPEVEQRLIPTTWRENGLGVFGELGDVSYRSYIVNGLEGSGFSASGLRGGRQKGAQALAEDLAWVGRVDWVPTPGFLLGGSVYVGDSGQTLADASGDIEVGTEIVEAHAEWRHRGLQLRALASRAELDDVARLNAALGLAGTSSVGEELTGAYVEAAYDLFASRPGRFSLSPYVRWEMLDTQSEVPSGFASSGGTDREILTLGVAFQPLDQVIFKVDWQDVDDEAGRGVDQLNLGLGYIF